MSDVQLWYAYNDKHETILINEANNKKKYKCPICGGDVIPRALSSSKITKHFAHIDKSSCENESVIHWWFKNKFLQNGDEIIVDNVNMKVSHVEIEKVFKTNKGIYNPDVCVYTDDGEIICFEYYYTCKKDVGKYAEIWNELNFKIVEININEMIDSSKVFASIDYNKDIKETEKKVKEEFFKQTTDYLDETIKEWVFKDLLNYKYDVLSFEELLISLCDLQDKQKKQVYKAMKSKKCLDLADKYKYDFDLFLSANGYDRVKYHLTGVNGFVSTKSEYYKMSIFPKPETILKLSKDILDSMLRDELWRFCISEQFKEMLKEFKLKDGYSLKNTSYGFEVYYYDYKMLGYDFDIKSSMDDRLHKIQENVSEVYNDSELFDYATKILLSETIDKCIKMWYFKNSSIVSRARCYMTNGENFGIFIERSNKWFNSDSAEFFIKTEEVEDLDKTLDRIYRYLNKHYGKVWKLNVR